MVTFSLCLEVKKNTNGVGRETSFSSIAKRVRNVAYIFFLSV